MPGAGIKADLTGNRPVSWTVLHSETILDRPPFLRLRQERVEIRPGQVIEDFYKVDLPEFALVIPFLDNGKVQLIRQYKHGAGREVLGFPAGFIDPGETAETAARRELLEETGLQADRLRSLGSFVDNGNQGCGAGHYFYARDCRKVAAPDPGDLEDFAYLDLAPVEIDAAIRDGAFGVVHHVAAWGLWRILENG